ncbi:unnamed protein product [Polarella glacialis]|nr:unnamed protein product [Polarella glacialis]
MEQQSPRKPVLKPAGSTSLVKKVGLSSASRQARVPGADVESRLGKLADSVMTAWVTRDQARLLRLLTQATGLQCTRLALARTGAAILLNSSSIWASLPDSWNEKRQGAVTRWKQLARLSPAQNETAKHPLCGLEPGDFLMAVNRLKKLYRCGKFAIVDTVPWHASLALKLVARGFLSPYRLEGLGPEVAKEFTAEVQEQAVLSRLIVKINNQQMRGRAQFQRKLALGADMPNLNKINALEFAQALTPAQVQELELAVKAQLHVCCLSDTGMKPMQTVAALTRARQEGYQVEEVLEARRDVLLIETNRRSLLSIVSGLRCWHYIAINILGIQPDAILPPRSLLDAEKFCTIFQNAGAATNYISYVRWACKVAQLDLSWDGPRLEMMLKGLKKEVLRLRTTEWPERWKLIGAMVHDITMLADQLEVPDFGDLAVLSWQFLFRVQSETIELEAGSAAHLVSLAPSRHRAVFLDAQMRLHVRLQRRKHRPQGSLLVRGCVCKSESPAVCAPRRAQALLSRKQLGEKLFSLSKDGFLKQLRGMLTLLGHQAAAQFVLKAFRAARATELARSGHPLHFILQQGEWRSAAALKYASADDLDYGMFLGRTLGESEGEQENEDSCSV